ncbi:hypothetical protein BGZ83_003224 [Gryganskiella cystojenkinii]|nr:hypothetical protein BGZ83_003224 [Gryganskiella cystojenkinii]
MTMLMNTKPGSALTPASYMKYKHVKSVVYRAKTSDSRKNINPTLSVKLWMKEIEDNGGKSTYIDKVTGVENNYLFAWCTKFQLEVMAKNRGVVCMDSTHKTVKSLLPDPKDDKVFPSAYLFTLLVRDREANCGVPIAFMVCNSESMPLDIYYCSFHVGQAWERNAKDLHGVQVCNEMRSPLKEIRNAKSEGERLQKWDDFTKAFQKIISI